MARGLRFILLAFSLSWGSWAWGLSRHGDGAPALADLGPWLAAGSFGPAGAALLLLWFQPDRRSALGAWAGSLVRVRAPLGLWLLLLLALPAGLGAGALLFGLEPAGESAAAVWLTIAVTALNGIFAGFLGLGPLGEEPGWRGYLNRLMLAEKWPTLGIAAAIGLVWTCWHLPLVLFTRDFVPHGLPLAQFLPLYTISLLAMAYALQQIWRCSQSVLLCVWFHGQCNAGLPFLADSIWSGAETNPAWHMGAAVTAAVIAAAAFALLRPPFRSAGV